MYLQNFGPRKTWLDKCQKSRISEDSSTVNMVNGSKHLFNINDSTFTIFIDDLENN